MRTFIFLVLLSAGLASCDPGIGVAIANHTDKDVQVKVIYPADLKFPGDTPHILGLRDSIKTYRLGEKDNYLHPLATPRLSWDTLARTYSFTLKADYSATVESRFLATSPTYGQVFVIDGTDAIVLKKGEKVFIKKPKLFLGGTWTYAINK